MITLTKTVLILPDTHYPEHDRRLWKATLQAIEVMEPDEIVHIGDLMDYPQPSRWTKGTREEFEGSVFEDSRKAIEEFIEPLRDVFSGPIKIHEGNHDLRPRVYLDKYAPALSGEGTFDFDKLLRFEDYGIEKLPTFYDIAPGWISTHGHMGGIRLNQRGGLTAINAVMRAGKSVVMGHTHRAGIISHTNGLEGRTSTVTGMEVGHIMDPKKVTYLKGGTGNWQQGLGVLTIDGRHVSPGLIPVSAGKIIVNREVIKV